MNQAAMKDIRTTRLKQLQVCHGELQLVHLYDCAINAKRREGYDTKESQGHRSFQLTRRKFEVWIRDEPLLTQDYQRKEQIQNGIKTGLE